MNVQQQLVEQNVRAVIGDLHVQLIMAQARVAELEQQLAALQQEVQTEGKSNGAADPKQRSAQPDA